MLVGLTKGVKTGSFEQGGDTDDSKRGNDMIRFVIWIDGSGGRVRWMGWGREMRNGDGSGKRERRPNQHHFDRFNSPYPLRHSSNSLSLRKLSLQLRQALHTLLLVGPFPVSVWSPTLEDMSQDGLGCK